MYDRKKITLFVLLIATIILGGVSLFLATQINNNQSPDDSQAGNQVCKRKDNAAEIEGITDLTAFCSSKSVDTCGAYPNSCELVTQTSSCGVAGQVILPGAVACIDSIRYRCDNGTPTNLGSCIGGACGNVLESCCSDNKCNGGLACNSAGKCATAVAPGGSCTPNEEVTDVCTGSGLCCTCASGSKCLGSGFTSCTTYCASLSGGSTSGGTASCSQNGEIISHGNTACIDGTNYTCTNGTATPGSSCTTDPGTSTGGSTGSTCTPSNPQKAKFIAPGRDAVLNTTTVTLQWQRNGTFGVACPTNDNKYRVKLLAVGLSESCPTSSLEIPNLPGQIEPGTSDEGTFNYQINVQDDTKYCWAIRKNNGDTVADTAVRSFTVNIEETSPTTGGGGDDGTGTTTSAPIDEDPTTGGNNATSSTGGTVAGSIAGDNTALPETAIISDELDPIILGMILVIIGLTLYKFDFGRKVEVE
jgi:hypothetical protein